MSAFASIKNVNEQRQQQRASHSNDANNYPQDIYEPGFNGTFVCNLQIM